MSDDRLRLPEWFLQFCVFLLYFYRISARQAFRTIDKMYFNFQKKAEFCLESKKKAIDFVQRLRDMNREYIILSPEEEEEVAPNDRSDRRNGRRIRRRSTSDSDSSIIEVSRKDSWYIRRSRRGYSTNKIHRFYTIFAERDMRMKREHEDQLVLKDIFGILRIRWIASEEISKTINLPFDSLKVIIGFNHITFEIRHTNRPVEVLTIIYKRGYDCCVVECADAEFRVPGVKYQSMAAQDFFHLIQNENLILTKLEFDIEGHDGFEKKWPFTSFYWKVEKYLGNLEHQLKMKVFKMKFFERPNHRTSNQRIVMSILPFLDPGTLLILHFSGWKSWDPENTVRLNAISQSEQWKKCHALYVSDDMIQLGLYDKFTGFTEVHMILPQDDFAHLWHAMNRYRPPESTLHWVAPFHTTFYVQRCFSRYSVSQIQRALPSRLQVNHLRNPRRITFQTSTLFNEECDEQLAPQDETSRFLQLYRDGTIL